MNLLKKKKEYSLMTKRWCYEIIWFKFSSKICWKHFQKSNTVVPSYPRVSLPRIQSTRIGNICKENRGNISETRIYHKTNTWPKQTEQDVHLRNSDLSANIFGKAMNSSSHSSHGLNSMAFIWKHHCFSKNKCLMQYFIRKKRIIIKIENMFKL